MGSRFAKQKDPSNRCKLGSDETNYQNNFGKIDYLTIKILA